MNTNCGCQEMKVGERKLAPNYYHFHNCAYVIQRNALIPEAERFAMREVEGMTPGVGMSNKFTRVFSGEMDRLARQRL